MICPKCKTQLPAGAVACAKCGTRFKTKTCPYCKSVILASAAACPRCGKPLGQAASAAASPAAASSASSQPKGGFRWWYILIGLGIFVLGVAFGAIGAGGTKQDKTKGEKASAISSSDSSQVLADKINLDGTWKQTNTKSETNYHAAVITGNTIEIYWINEEESSRSLYWAGTVTIPEEPASEFSWNSDNDKSKTENSILASGDATKAFSYKDGKISYEASAMGTTATVQLEKTEASIPGLEASSQPEQTPQTTAESDASVEGAIAILETAVQQGFQDNYTIASEGNTIMVSVWMDGVAMDVTAIRESGGNAEHPNWVEAKTSFLSMYDSFSNLLEAGGYSNYSLVMSTLNDLNHENTLLTIANGEVIFDALADT